MSEDCKENNLTRKIFKLISKLRLVKPTKEIEVINDVKNQIKIVQASISEKNKNAEEIENYINELEEGNSSKRFKLFCHEIEKFIIFLKDNEDLNFYIHKYPQLLQKRLNIDVDELQIVLAEIKDAMTNIKKLKSQQKLIKKEISTMNRSIPRIKDTEINELELILSHHDKDLYTRWIKSKWKFEAIEELMFNIQKKQLAMDTLNTLISRYLDKIKKNNVLTNDLPEENSINKNKSDSLLSSISSSPSKIPPPPPILPIPLTVTTLNRNNSKHSWVQRRFRAERRGNFGSVRPITEYQENEPYVFSLNLNNTRNNTSSNTSILKSQSSRLSTSSSNHILNSSSNNQIGTENSTRQFKNDLELKPEIRSVFQALLGQRTIPLMITNG